MDLTEASERKARPDRARADILDQPLPDGERFAAPRRTPPPGIQNDTVTISSQRVGATKDRACGRAAAENDRSDPSVASDSPLSWRRDKSSSSAARERPHPERSGPRLPRPRQGCSASPIRAGRRPSRTVSPAWSHPASVRQDGIVGKHRYPLLRAKVSDPLVGNWRPFLRLNGCGRPGSATRLPAKQRMNHSSVNRRSTRSAPQRIAPSHGDHTDTRAGSDRR